jgi:hypothetical protein
MVDGAVDIPTGAGRTRTPRFWFWRQPSRSAMLDGRCRRISVSSTWGSARPTSTVGAELLTRISTPGSAQQTAAASATHGGCCANPRDEPARDEKRHRRFVIREGSEDPPIRPLPAARSGKHMLAQDASRLPIPCAKRAHRLASAGSQRRPRARLQRSSSGSSRSVASAR